MDKTKRNEVILTLAEINNIIEDLERLYSRNKEATDVINQLLHAYEIKVTLLNNI